MGYSLCIVAIFGHFQNALILECYLSFTSHFLFYAKNVFVKQVISRNESILKMAKNGHFAKAIAHAKYSVLVKK